MPICILAPPSWMSAILEPICILAPPSWMPICILAPPSWMPICILAPPSWNPYAYWHRHLGCPYAYRHRHLGCPPSCLPPSLFDPNIWSQIYILFKSAEASKELIFANQQSRYPHLVYRHLVCRHLCLIQIFGPKFIYYLSLQRPVKSSFSPTSNQGIPILFTAIFVQSKIFGPKFIIYLRLLRLLSSSFFPGMIPTHIRQLIETTTCAMLATGEIAHKSIRGTVKRLQVPNLYFYLPLTTHRPNWLLP